MRRSTRITATDIRRPDSELLAIIVRKSALKNYPIIDEADVETHAADAAADLWRLGFRRTVED